jgi:hypothetical protein
MEQGKLACVIEAHTGGVRGLAFSPDGSMIASCCIDEPAVKIWDSSTGSLIQSISIDTPQSVAFSADGRLVFAAYWTDRMWSAWDIESGARKLWFPVTNNSIVGDGATVIAVSPDGRFMLFASTVSGISFWELGTKRLAWKTPRYPADVDYAAFSSDGARIVVTQSDGSTRILDGASGRELCALYPYTDGEWVSVAPGGWFSASEHGAERLNVRQRGQVLGVSSFYDTYYRPDIVEASLAGKDVASLVSGRSIENGFKTPPLMSIETARTDGSFRGLKITSVESPSDIRDGELSVRVTAEDTGGGISGVRLFLNEKLAGEWQPEAAAQASASSASVKLETVFAVSLASGENVLRAVGLSGDRTESNPIELRLTWAAPVLDRPRLVLLGIGVDKYLNPKYDLNYATTDARSFLAALTMRAKGLFASVQSELLLDEQATREGLIAALGRVATNARSQDVFVFFYAGHGIALDADTTAQADFNFVLHGLTQMTDPEKVRAAGVSGAEFRELASKVKAQKQVLLIDACNSGALAEAFAKRGAAEEIALRKLSRSTGAALIAASKADQFAQEFATLGHGAFTQALIDGVNGKAATASGQVTAASLKTYVEDALPVLSRKYLGTAQFPTGFLSGQDFPLCLK